ncbi:MAG: dihydrolipoamide acetyltransferase family protein [Pseudomonadota bacterium]
MSQLFAFTMPKWGIEMSEGVVADWLVEPGDVFHKGDVIMAVETEKIVNDIEAEIDGVLLKAIAEVGETYSVGTLLGVLGPEGTPTDVVDAFIAKFSSSNEHYQDNEEQESFSETAVVTEEEVIETLANQNISGKAAELAQRQGLDLSELQGCGRNNRVQLQDVERLLRQEVPKDGPGWNNSVDASTFDDKVNATPVAQLAAAKSNVDLTDVKGTGKDGRVRLRDLPKPGANKEAPDRVPFNSMRRKIAERLTHAYQTIPHYYLETEVRMDEVMAERELFNGQSPENNASINDFIVKACAVCLRKHPNLNVHVGDDYTIPFSDINVALAVALDDGLVTPVLAKANTLSMNQLTAESSRLIRGAKSGKLNFKDYSGGTFTVSNLGMFGVSKFTAIINPPQAGILSVGAVTSKVLAVDGKLRLGQGMTLVLGLDHRVIDGAAGGQFLADLKALLESPSELLG